MGIINALFAPFIVLYLLLYSFFRYFEVRPSPPLFFHRLSGVLILGVDVGVPQEPVFRRRTDVHPARPVDLSGVQRAAASV